MIPDRRHLAQLSRPSVLSKTVLAMAGSVSAAVDSLRAALDEQRRKAKATTRRLLQQERKSKLMDSKASSARQKAMDVAHILFSMSYPDHADAEEYLKSRPNNLFPEEPAELRRRLELRFARSGVRAIERHAAPVQKRAVRRHVMKDVLATFEADLTVLSRYKALIVGQTPIHVITAPDIEAIVGSREFHPAAVFKAVTVLNAE